MKNILRILFVLIIAVELLAWAGRIPLPDPTFTWFGLVGTALIAWTFLEIAKPPFWLQAVAFGHVTLDAYSDIYQLYGRWAPTYPWDRVMHVLGGAVVALFAIELLSRAFRNGLLASRRPLLALALGTVLVTGFAGYGYEVWEYITDTVYTKKSIALGDGRDTVDDLNLNVLGSLLALAGSYPFLKRSRPLSSS